MNVVGLKIEKGYVAAAVVMKRFGKAELVDSFSRSFATDGELVEILKEKAKDWAGARVVSSIPGRYFSQRIVRFPFDDRKRVEKALPFELEDVVPFSLDEVILDHLVLQGVTKGAEGGREATVLAVMLPKTVLRQHLELLAAAGLDPQVIVPSYAGLYHVAAMMKVETCAALLCGYDLCVKNGETVAALKGFSASPTGGILHTLKAVEAERKIQVEKALLVCGDRSVPPEIAGLGIPVEQLSPEFEGKKASDAASLGLAFADHINLRKGEFVYRRADEGEWRRRRALIIAGAAAALLAAVNVGVKFAVVEAGYGRLHKEMEEIYRRTFPESKAKGDLLKLMRTSLEDAKKKFGALGAGTSALDAMKAVTEGVPKEARVAFQEFNLEGERLRLQGEAGSFEAVDKIKAELQKAEQFAEVVVQDTRMGVENKVKFRMEIKLKEKM